MRSLPLIWAALAAVLATAPAAARRHDPEKLPVTRIRDLHYGDVLFYYFQDDDFEALTRLTAYEHWNLIPHHEEEAQLLLGGLYLSLGMHNEAGARFESVLNQDVPTGVRNRAWYYLAQVWYARGYLDKAEEALRKINGKLSPELEAEKAHLFANVLMHEGKFDEAIRLLSAWHGANDWTAYAKFNVGVALVRVHRLADADPLLTSVGSMDAGQEEMLALKDRANLALGYAYLQANDPAKARIALERVRLNGPYSNKALLGTGYADSQLGDYKGALSPWLELRNRNLLDSAVQESFIAVPYAFAQLGANSQSAEYYEGAVESYDKESGSLDAAIDRIREGSLLKDLLASEHDSRHGWFWQLQNIPDAPESRYLYTILAGHDFQEGLKNYRDLDFMGNTLARWNDSMEAFSDMIDTREQKYSVELPKVDHMLASAAADKLQQRRADLEARLNTIESTQDVAALGSPEERDQWARIQRLEAALAGAADTPENAELRDRVRLVKGVLFFRLNDSFKARMWQQRRTMKDLDLSLREAQSRWIRVERARKSVPTNNGDFAARVAALKQRIDELQTRLAGLESKQSGYLAQIAVEELDAQKNRLAAYQVQARFALATMYDRAANTDITHTQQSVAPQQKGPEGSTAAPGTQTAPGSTQAPAPGSTQAPAPDSTQAPAPDSTQAPAPATPSPAPPQEPQK
jgi:Tfp pilus assembly protein PilF